MREYDATERAWKNGAEHMKQQIIDKLRDMKGVAAGPSRLVISYIIEMVKKLEVRP